MPWGLIPFYLISDDDMGEEYYDNVCILIILIILCLPTNNMGKEGTGNIFQTFYNFLAFLPF